MREDICKFRLCTQARVQVHSGEMLILDPVYAKHVKCDWFKHFGAKVDVKVQDPPLEERVNVATTRQVERLSNKTAHYQAFLEGINRSNSEHLAPPRLIQGQHGVYVSVGFGADTYAVVEEKNGYAILFDSDHNPKAGEVRVESGMLMVADCREIVNFEKGIELPAGLTIKALRGTYVCSFSKYNLRLRIKKD